jgi:hypothetical protein
VNVAPLVSVATVSGSHPSCAVIVDSASLTSHATATSETYQPAAPSVPDTDGVTTGGVMSSVVGRHSQIPYHEAGGSATGPTKNEPLNGYQPYPAPPAIG